MPAQEDQQIRLWDDQRKRIRRLRRRHVDRLSMSTSEVKSAVPKGFGSFQSASVEVLIRQTDFDYVVPPIPIKQMDADGIRG